MCVLSLFKIQQKITVKEKVILNSLNLIDIKRLRANTTKTLEKNKYYFQQNPSFNKQVYGHFLYYFFASSQKLGVFIFLIVLKVNFIEQNLFFLNKIKVNNKIKIKSAIFCFKKFKIFLNEKCL